MKKLFGYADQYVKESSWKDLALLKCCLCAMGILIGANAPEKHKTALTGVAAGVFAATYIPLMAKYFGIVCQKGKTD